MMCSVTDDPDGWPRNGAGHLALWAGLLALSFAFFPFVGEYVSVPTALVALAAAAVGMRRADREIATNGGQALLGGALGLLGLAVTALVWAATHGM